MLFNPLYTHLLTVVWWRADGRTDGRYQKLSSNYRERDHEWTHAEQLDLLRGFQAFGERWPLVRIFYLPHRRAQQLRAK
jgi:hypothetical protein